LRGRNIETRISRLDSVGSGKTVTFGDDSLQMIGFDRQDDEQSQPVGLMLVTTWLNSHNSAAVEALLTHPPTSGNGTILPLLNSNIISVNLVQRQGKLLLDNVTVRIR